MDCLKCSRIWTFQYSKNAVDEGADNFNVIAINAARIGYFDIIKYAVDNGADYFKLIAPNAAEGGHFNIVNMLFIKVLIILIKLH